MTVKKIITAITASAILALIIGIAATAFSFGVFAPVSGKQAAAAAVAQTGGYAEDVEFEYDYYTGSRYEVEVIADGQKHKVIVDANSGKVLAVKGQYRQQHDNHYPVPAASAVNNG
ncbi:PepSY domain-containing protein [Neisseria dentiae]|uniref:PepSY domain-containing protein n=1 Tax=Neisseria dentiae TaxID=194197 RepID=UPI0035A06D1A